MDCTALDDELCEGPKIATTPKDSWSQARKEREKSLRRKQVMLAHSNFIKNSPKLKFRALICGLKQSVFKLI